jgi:DNA-binding NarL/FixJ family response regulator
MVFYNHRRLTMLDDLLSPQQAKVLPLVVAGFSNKMIARELGIREGTVKVHLAAAFGKLGVHNRAAVAVRGASEGRTEPARRDCDRVHPACGALL